MLWREANRVQYFTIPSIDDDDFILVINKLQRKIFMNCGGKRLGTVSHPIMEKPNAMFFGIKYFDLKNKLKFTLRSDYVLCNN